MKQEWLQFSLSLPGCAMSGLIADAKTLIDKARVETQVRADISVLKLATHPRNSLKVLGKGRSFFQGGKLEAWWECGAV